MNDDRGAQPRLRVVRPGDVPARAVARLAYAVRALPSGHAWAHWAVDASDGRQVGIFATEADAQNFASRCGAPPP